MGPWPRVPGTGSHTPWSFGSGELQELDFQAWFPSADPQQQEWGSLLAPAVSQAVSGVATAHPWILSPLSSARPGDPWILLSVIYQALVTDLLMNSLTSRQPLFCSSYNL